MKRNTSAWRPPKRACEANRCVLDRTMDGTNKLACEKSPQNKGKFDIMRGKRILTTGAAGFIGFHTCRRLQASGARVLGVDDLNAYYDVALKQARLARLEGLDGFSFERCDVADKARVLALLAAFKTDYVAHLAAPRGVRF